jgi:mono/diheme cytochrome c family protein
MCRRVIAFLFGVVMCLPAQEARARAVLEQNCVRCHGGDKTMGGVDLSSGDGLRRVVVAGKPEESRLMLMVEAGKMPMGGPKLDSADVAVLRDWIRDGARVTEKAAAAETRAGTKRTFWSLREPVKGTPPSNARNPVDAFVQAKVAEKGLTQAPRADHRTLIRRISFDLTGLPPSADLYSLTYEQAIDKLLASPEYGERWGRHWLDIVRFGETDGGEHNYERFHAWRYRDYVIRSFNEDKPYDRFIREQLAGDLLEPENPDMVAATGFLVAGPWDQVSAELNKDKVMAATARMDELDDMVTTTFATFQAMTVNCARCHDHKFDPIPTRDYYRLTSVFAGAGFGNRKVATVEAEAAYESSAKPVRESLAKVRQELAQIEDPVRVPMLRAKYQEFDGQREGATARMPLNPIWNRNRFEAVSARHWRLVITSHPGKTASLKDLELRPAGVTVTKREGEYEASDDRPLIVPLPDTDQPVAEMTWSGPLNVYRLEASTDGVNWRTVGSSLDHVNGVEIELPTVSEEEVLSALTVEAREQRLALLAKRKKLEAELAAIPAPPMVYAAKPRKPEKSYLLERGSVTRQKEEVTPGALTALAHRSADFALAAETPDAERRLALADWITDPRNPLTARVIVNRVWQYHFGQGIVNTPSDLGLNGDRPSHLELLDWLAVSLRENGWRLNWLHRLILTSDTYRQSDRFDEKANAVDAGNRLLWRMPLRRMDAETLRDSILFVSGKLDRETRGGPGFALQKKGSGGSYIYQALDNDGPSVWRRAVYRFVVRGGERVMLDSFDCPDPAVATPQRTTSNTPLQALTLLNNEFVIRQAGFLAERLQREGGDPVERAYDLLFGRTPTQRERELGMNFLKSQPLAAYCRVLLNSNEFVYVP